MCSLARATLMPLTSAASAKRHNSDDGDVEEIEPIARSRSNSTTGRRLIDLSADLDDSLEDPPSPTWENVDSEYFTPFFTNAASPEERKTTTPGDV